MRLTKWLQICLMIIAVMSVVGCSSARKAHPNDAAVNDANAAYVNNDSEAKSLGLGEEGSGFGSQSDDQTNNADNLSKRIYYFDFDSNAVHEDDKLAIEANADYLLAHSNAKILLEGHTDPRGSREYNIGLGERRGQAVADIFFAKGVSPRQVRVVSYGAQKLAALGHNEEDYQQDRRVALVFIQR